MLVRKYHCSVCYLSYNVKRTLQLTMRVNLFKVPAYVSRSGRRIIDRQKNVTFHRCGLMLLAGILLAGAIALVMVRASPLKHITIMDQYYIATLTEFSRFFPFLWLS
jgi:hypothetical protein